MKKARRKRPATGTMSHERGESGLLRRTPEGFVIYTGPLMDDPTTAIDRDREERDRHVSGRDDSTE